MWKIKSLIFFTVFCFFAKDLFSQKSHIPLFFVDRDIDHITISDSIKTIKEWEIKLDSSGKKNDSTELAEYFFTNHHCFKIKIFNENIEILFLYDESGRLIEQKYNYIKEGFMDFLWLGSCENLPFDEEEKFYSRTLLGTQLEKKIYINKEQNCMVEQKYYYKKGFCVAKEIYISGKLTKKIFIEYIF